jgi:hypothetical protein
MISIPQYETYYQFLSLFNKLHSRGGVRITAVNYNNDATLSLHFTPGFARSIEAKGMRKILKLPASNQDIIFSAAPAGPSAGSGINNIPGKEAENSNGSSAAANQGAGPGMHIIPGKDAEPASATPITQSTAQVPSNVVTTEMRSVVGVMNYFAHGVQIPPSHLRSGLAHQDFINGKPFNWEPLIHGVIRICSSERKPLNAFVKVYIHNHWFYIRNDDPQSKLALNFLRDLIILSAGQELGPVSNTVPILTHNV